MKTRAIFSQLLPIALALGLLPSCTTTKITPHLEGREKPPVLKQVLKNEPSTHAYQIRSFQIRHVWGGNKGYVGAYRALITVWSKGGGAVAELYFHDSGQGMPENPNPNKSFQQPYQIHFPFSAMEVVLHELRFASEPVYLFYYQPANENEWAVGVLREEEHQAYKRP